MDKCILKFVAAHLNLKKDVVGLKQCHENKSIESYGIFDIETDTYFCGLCLDSDDSVNRSIYSHYWYKPPFRDFSPEAYNTKEEAERVAESIRVLYGYKVCVKQLDLLHTASGVT